MKTIFLFLLLFCFSSFQKDLQTELIDMCQREECLRMQLTKNSTPELERQVMKVDHEHLCRLQEIIDEYGLPSYSAVGEKGAYAFWLLVQHIPDLPFQRRCYALLEEFLQGNHAAPQDVEYLKERICIASGEASENNQNEKCPVFSMRCLSNYEEFFEINKEKNHEQYAKIRRVLLE